MAEARSSIRRISRENLGLLQNALWALLAVSMIGLSGLNAFQRTSEVGVLQAVGYGQTRVVVLFVLRAVVLTVVGAAIGIAIGAALSLTQSSSLFAATGKKMSIDWSAAIMIGAIATALAALASCLPALLAAMKNPADLIGSER